MILKLLSLSLGVVLVAGSVARAEEKFEAPLCEAAKDRRVIELIYDKDQSKGCEARIVDVHQIARGKNGLLYMRGYQHRGCTKGRDFAAARIFRFDKIKSVEMTDGAFSGKSPDVKQDGWNGCLGNNCFIDQIICE